MPDPVPDHAAAVEYFRRYGAQYSVEVLSERLRHQGIAPAVLAAAVHDYNEWRLEAAHRRRSSLDWRVAAWTCGILLAVVAVGALAIGLCINYMGLPSH